MSTYISWNARFTSWCGWHSTSGSFASHITAGRWPILSKFAQTSATLAHLQSGWAIVIKLGGSGGRAHWSVGFQDSHTERRLNNTVSRGTKVSASQYSVLIGTDYEHGAY